MGVVAPGMVAAGLTVEVAALTVGVAGVAVRLAGRLGCLAATELDGAGGLFQGRRHQRQRSSVA